MCCHVQFVFARYIQPRTNLTGSIAIDRSAAAPLFSSAPTSQLIRRDNHKSNLSSICSSHCRLAHPSTAICSRDSVSSSMVPSLAPAVAVGRPWVACQAGLGDSMRWTAGIVVVVRSRIAVRRCVAANTRRSSCSSEDMIC